MFELQHICIYKMKFLNIPEYIFAKESMPDKIKGSDDYYLYVKRGYNLVHIYNWISFYVLMYNNLNKKFSQILESEIFI